MLVVRIFLVDIHLLVAKAIQKPTPDSITNKEPIIGKFSSCRKQKYASTEVPSESSNTTILYPVLLNFKPNSIKMVVTNIIAKATAPI